MDGNADLMVRRGSLPNVGAYDGGSFLHSTNRDAIIFTTNSLLPNLNGEWYLAVPNNEARDVILTIRATLTLTNPPPPPAIIRLLTPVMLPGGVVEVTWTSTPGQIYALEASLDLIQWIRLYNNVLSQGATTTVRVQAGPTMMFFRVQRTP
jgi:hypothetical protein